jgi:hypothetical protein
VGFSFIFSFTFLHNQPIILSLANNNTTGEIMGAMKDLDIATVEQIKQRGKQILAALEYEGEELRRTYQEATMLLLADSAHQIGRAQNALDLSITGSAVERRLAEMTSEIMEWKMRQKHIAFCIDALLHGTGLRKIESSARRVEGTNGGSWPVVK